MTDQNTYPRSYVAGGDMPLVGSPKANWALVRGQTNRCLKNSKKENKNKDCVPGLEGYRDPALEAWGRGS